jgi:hypothetical protein
MFTKRFLKKRLVLYPILKLELEDIIPKLANVFKYV